MQKVLAFPNAAAQQTPPAGVQPGESSQILERSGHTFIGSVLFADIVEYSKKPVAEQTSRLPTGSSSTPATAPR
jgi:hypothetical protein